MTKTLETSKLHMAPSAKEKIGCFWKTQKWRFLEAPGQSRKNQKKSPKNNTGDFLNPPILKGWALDLGGQVGAKFEDLIPSCRKKRSVHPPNQKVKKTWWGLK